MKKILLIINTVLFFSLFFHDAAFADCVNERFTPPCYLAAIEEIPDDVLASVYRFLNSVEKQTKYLEDNAISVVNEECIRKMLEPIDFKVGLTVTENLSEYQDNARKVVDTYKDKILDKINFDKLALATMAIKNLARDNYVFLCPGNDKWLIKIASPSNRMVNLFAAAGFNYYSLKPMEEDNLEIFYVGSGRTYQTVSRAQVAYALRSLIKRDSLKHVYAPKTFLYQLHSLKEKSYTTNDSNSFVVQERVPGIKHLHENKDLILDTELVTPDMVRELKLCIEGAMLWNIKLNLAICMDPESAHYKKLILFDNEQRNISAPKEIYGVSKDTYNHITSVGLKEAKDLFSSREDLLDALSF